MIRLTEELKTAINNALVDMVPCILATATPDGRPSVGYRGNVMAYDGTRLAYWERTFRRGAENVEANPNVVIMYRNPETRKAWKFFGRAKVHRDGPVRQAVMNRVVEAEMNRDPERRRVAVIVRLDKVETMAGEVLMSAEEKS